MLNKVTDIVLFASEDHYLIHLENFQKYLYFVDPDMTKKLFYNT